MRDFEQGGGDVGRASPAGAVADDAAADPAPRSAPRPPRGCPARGRSGRSARTGRSSAPPSSRAGSAGARPRRRKRGIRAGWRRPCRTARPRSAPARPARRGGSGRRRRRRRPAAPPPPLAQAASAAARRRAMQLRRKAVFIPAPLRLARGSCERCNDLSSALCRIRVPGGKSDRSSQARRAGDRRRRLYRQPCRAGAARRRLAGGGDRQSRHRLPLGGARRRRRSPRATSPTRPLVARLIAEHGIGAIIHFAGSVVVPESVENPLKYYENNTVKSRSLIESAVKGGVRHFIFSSTAATYGIPERVPVAEDVADPADQPLWLVEADDRADARRRRRRPSAQLSARCAISTSPAPTRRGAPASRPPARPI